MVVTVRLEFLHTHTIRSVKPQPLQAEDRNVLDRGVYQVKNHHLLIGYWFLPDLWVDYLNDKLTGSECCDDFNTILFVYKIHKGVPDQNAQGGQHFKNLEKQFFKKNIIEYIYRFRLQNTVVWKPFLFQFGVKFHLNIDTGFHLVIPVSLLKVVILFTLAWEKVSLNSIRLTSEQTHIGHCKSPRFTIHYHQNYTQIPCILIALLIFITGAGGLWISIQICCEKSARQPVYKYQCSYLFFYTLGLYCGCIETGNWDRIRRIVIRIPAG